MGGITKVAALNDEFRRTMLGGRVVMAQGVHTLALDKQVRVMEAVRTFNSFNVANDPWSEHDFGSFVLDGEKYWWKIDCYAPDMLHSSEDPTDPAKTIRVLTVGAPSDY